jgi:hypothetical protein
MHYRSNWKTLKISSNKIRINSNLQSAHFVKLDNIGHGGMASTQPQKMADMLSKLIKDSEPDDKSERR